MVAPLYTRYADRLTPLFVSTGVTGIPLSLNFETEAYKVAGATKTFADLIAFARLSSATYRDNAGVIQTVTSGNERLDHDKDGVALGLLMEESRTNTFNYSEAIASWTTLNATITSDATAAPDGNTTADKLNDDGSTGTAGVYARDSSITVVVSSDYTFSVFGKADQLSRVALNVINFTTPANYQDYYDLSGVALGTINGLVDAGIDDYGSGWARPWTSFLSDAADTAGLLYVYPIQTDGSLIVDLDGTSSVFVWGAQFENGPYPTSYIPNLGTGSTTRAAETAKAAVTGWDFSATVGTLYAVVTPDHTPTAEVILASFNDDTANEVIEVYADASANVRLRVTDGGVDQADIDSGVNAVGGTELKIAIAWAAGDFAISVDGSFPLTDASGTLPAVTQLEPCESGHTAVLQYWNERKTDVEIRALSGWTLFDSVLLLMQEPAAVGSDPNFSSVEFLGSGADISDLSGQDHKITLVGNPFYQSGKLDVSDSTTTYAAIASSADFTPAGDFTAEIFGVEFSSIGTRGIMSFGGASPQWSWYVNLAAGPVLQATLSTDGITLSLQISETVTAVINTPYDFCLEREGSTVRLYMGGSVIGSGTLAGALHASTHDLLLGYLNAGTTGSAGRTRWKAKRFTDTVALYGGAYTVPTLPLPIE